MPGLKFTIVRLVGKLYAETLKGNIRVKTAGARHRILSPVGEVLKELTGRKDGEETVFELFGDVPGIQYHLITE